MLIMSNNNNARTIIMYSISITLFLRKDRGYNPLHLEGTTAFRLFGNPLGATLRELLYNICRILSIKLPN